VRDLHGYKSNTVGVTFLNGYNLESPTYLYYDGHPGYDYPFYYKVGASLTAVYPTVNGCVSYKINGAGGATQSAFHTLAIVPMSIAPPNNQCPNPLPASATGFVVFYLHLATYLGGTDGNTVMV
jgi:hypothetical protein